MMAIALASLKLLGEWVWATSLQASAAIVLVVALQALLRHRLPARWIAALWLIVLLRLALPWAPQSAISLYGWWPQRSQSKVQRLRVEENQNTSLSVVAEFDPIGVSAAPERPAAARRITAPQPGRPRIAGAPAIRKHAASVPLWWAWMRAHPFLAAWLAGALSLMTALAIRTVRFSRRVARLRPVTDGRWLDQLEDCKAEMKVHAPITLVQTECVHGPMILGFIRPRLLMPAGLLERLTAEQARCIFLHELAHIRRHDILMGWVMALLLVIHWFNPLVWLANMRLRADREMACDAEALDRLQEGERKEYGRTLMRLAEELSAAPLMPTMAGIAEHKMELERRILMITRFKRPVWMTSLMGAALIVMCGACLLTRPKTETLLQDRIDHPFVNDPAVVAEWKAVDFVQEPGEFAPGRKQCVGELYIQALHVHQNGFWDCSTTQGPSPQQVYRWTRGLLIDPTDRTASPYEIRELGGRQYLFMEWKSGDYTVRHQKPNYYVLEKANGATSEVAAKQKRAGSDGIQHSAMPEKLLPLSIHKHPGPANFSRPIEKLPTYNPDSDADWQMDLRSRDVSGFKLAGRLRDLTFADFDSKTKWPAELPEGFDPKRIMEMGRNPGLGLRKVHAKGITGKGVGVAIIDQNLLADHAEYKDRLRHYEEINWPEGATQASMHGAAVASIAVGRNVGVAPEADLYYLAAMNGRRSATGNDFEWDFTSLSESIHRALDINRTLPDGKKIRVISISVGWSPEQKGYAAAMAAVERAKKEGVFVVSSSLEETFGMRFHGLGRAPLSDPDQAQSYEPGLWWRKRFFSGPESGLGDDTLLVPMDSRCTASPTGVEDEVFYRQGGWSWSIPYIAGMYALACQVKPDVTPETFWKAALETGVTIQVGQQDGGSGIGIGSEKTHALGRIAQPEKMLERLTGK